ncbi:PP2C family protein-serine/threonine phosphatase [Streptomyces sp. NBC_01006]|uniref:PP2C family protein-serine/threonine phosphatase n=1 Tax=Streptomyces sp. NBC_01006 TaxID=2903716 RepID=UPI00386DD901|nr:serine/threonine-protein phosphatase [Streptomyces sp. NBC_01006]
MPQVRRVCVLAWGGAAVSWELSTPGRLGASLASCAAFLLLAAGCALHIRRALMAELRRMQEIAGAAQRALLRPLPGRIEGLTLAAAQLSASRGAAVGGDLYEAVPTAYGVRAVIGDVRGHGLPALGAAAAVLGAFREAAYDEPALGGVLVRMERALARHVRGAEGAPEEFVTVLLLQIAEDGSVLALNCGHPWPYLLREPQPLEPCGASPRPALSPYPGLCPDPRLDHRHVQPRPRSGRGVRGGAPVSGRGGVGKGSAQPGVEVRTLDGGETYPPLGVVPVQPDLQPQDCGRLWPGDVLFLHTDGAEDARDAEGRFFPLRSVLAEQSEDTPARLVAGVHAALLRHTGGQLTDDVALLVLRSDRDDRGC